MTTQEAIEILEKTKGAVVMDKEFETAYNMAIKSLKAWEKVKEEIRETYDEFRDNDVLIANGITMCDRIIKKHTEG